MTTQTTPLEIRLTNPHALSVVPAGGGTPVLDVDTLSRAVRLSGRLVSGDFSVSEAGSVTFPNNVYVNFIDGSGVAQPFFILNQLDNFFINCLAGKAIYMARGQDNAEIAFFGGAGSSLGVKDFYIDGADATALDTLVNSANVYLRGMVWDGAASVPVTFEQQVEALTAGAVAARRAVAHLRFGTFGAEADFLDLLMDAGPVYSIDLLQDTTVAAAKSLLVNTLKPVGAGTVQTVDMSAQGAGPVTFRLDGRTAGQQPIIETFGPVGGGAVSFRHVFSGDGKPRMNLSASGLYFGTGGAVDTSLVRSAAGIWAVTDAFEFTEMSAPSTPAANKLRAYAKDIGGAGLLLFKNSEGIETTLVGIGRPLRTTFWNYADFLNWSPRVHEGWLSQASSGAGAAWSNGGSEASHPGIWEGSTGTTAAGHSRLASHSDSITFSNGKIRMGVVLKTGALSTAAQRYYLYMGIIDDNNPTALTDGVQIRYQDNINGGDWEGVVSNGGGHSTLDLDVAVAANTWYLLEWEINAAGNSVEFFVNGTSCGTIASGPAANSTAEIRTGIMKRVGTTSRSAYWDAYYIYGEMSTAR